MRNGVELASLLHVLEASHEVQRAAGFHAGCFDDSATLQERCKQESNQLTMEKVEDVSIKTWMKFEA